MGANQKRHIWTFLLVIIIIINGCNKKATSESNEANNNLKKVYEILKDGKTVYKKKEASQIVNDLIPIIEKIAGKKFLKKPTIHLISTEKAETLLLREYQQKIKNNTDISSENINSTQNRLLAKMILGFYAKCDQKLYLLPQRIPAVLRIFGIDNKYAMDIAKMNIAHELVHALQDQNISLIDKLRKINSTDGIHAFLSTIEGHAIFIEKRIGKYLKINNSIIEMFPLVKNQNINTTTYRNNGQKMHELMRSFPPFKMIYSQGEKFISYHYHKYGNEKIWSILNYPPIDTSMITYPETYSAKSYDKTNYKEILNNVYDFQTVGDLSRLDLTYSNDSHSKYTQSQIWQDLDIGNKNLVISKITHRQTLTVSFKHLEMASISLIVLNNKKFVPYLFSIESKYFIKSTQDAADSIIDIINCTEDYIKNYRKILGTDIFKNSKGEERPVKSKFVIVSKNNIVVMYNDVLLGLDDCEILKIAERIFTRYQKTKNSARLINIVD